MLQSGKTPLHMAINNSHTDVLEILASFKATIDVKDIVS